MTKITNFKGKPDPPVKIFVETASEIFRLCMAKATPDKYGSIYNGLAEDIIKEFENRYVFEDAIDGKYLTNTNSRLNAAKRHNETYIGFAHTYILRLAKFAGIDDYVSFDKKNAPVISTPVLFTQQPFKLFDLIRVPTLGLLLETDTGFEYKGSNNIEISGNVNDVNLFTMPGDRSQLWIEVIYSNPDGKQKAYFSEDNQLIQPVSESGRLFRFFAKKTIHT
jgi:hypothetical protein